jgi:hypothetical protein
MSFSRPASFLCSKHRQDAASHKEKRLRKRKSGESCLCLLRSNSKHQRAGFFKVARFETNVFRFFLSHFNFESRPGVTYFSVILWNDTYPLNLHFKNVMVASGTVGFFFFETYRVTHRLCNGRLGSFYL